MHAHALKHLLPFLTPGARVLDVGSGSGYLTQIMGGMVGAGGGRVIGIEHIQALADLGAENVGRSSEGRDMLRSGVVKFVKGDGRRGWRDDAPYDAIHVGAAAKEIHAELLEQLKAPGR